jgi:hypothetical protein
MTPKTRQVLLEEAKSTYDRQVSYIDFLYNQEKSNTEQKKECRIPLCKKKVLPVEDEGFLFVPREITETYINLPCNIGEFKLCDALFEVVKMFHEKDYPTLFAHDIIVNTRMWRFHERSCISRSLWKVIQAKIFPRIGIDLVGKSKKYAADKTNQNFNRILAEVFARQGTGDTKKNINVAVSAKKYSAASVFDESSSDE